MKNDDVLDILQKNVDKAYLKFNAKIVSSKYEMLGVRIPVLKSIAKEIDSFDLSEDPNYEEVLIYGLVLAKKKDLKFDEISNFVSLIDNWAICDCFVSELKLKKDDEFFKFLCENIKTHKICKENEFIIRFSIVAFLRWFLPSKTKQVFEVLAEINCDIYYINMAISWCLCEGIIKDYENTLPYLLKQTKWVRNKAIQKCVESFRIDGETKEYLKSLKC